MLVRQVMQVLVAVVVVWESTSEAATMAAVKLCGRQLSEIMSRVCHAYNSPWDVPTVVEQPAAVARRKRQLGIADECCVIGCTWEQLSEYCSISAYSESPLEDLEAHIIEDRSAEASARGHGGVVGAAPGAVSRERRRDGEVGEVGEVGRTRARARTRGYGRARARCWCRRRRRSGRRRTELMGNMVVKSARAAPVVGTVSPLITWGRTLNTDLPVADRDRYAYVVYT